MPPPTGPIDIALSLFSGLDTELAPPDLPEGVSPDNQDVVYLPGSVASRPGLHKIFAQPLPVGAAQTVEVRGMDTYLEPNGNPLNLYLDSAGVLRGEDVSTSPGVTSVLAQVMPGAYMKSVTAPSGKQYFAFHDGEHGADIPLQFDGSVFDRVSQDGPGAPPALADSAAAGAISAGAHQCVVMFLTRQGYITQPSPPVSWTAAGGKKVTLSNLPLGPANVVARIVAFTGSGGANFFYIPISVTVPVAVASTVVSDNTTTTLDLDFDDNALFAATAIDIPGNNLFSQVVLTPCLGVTSFGSRLLWWGEYNKVQRFLNMGFDGGYLPAGGGMPNLPLGWTTYGNGALVAPNDGLSFGLRFGQAWKINGGGANPQGLLTQSAYQNALGNAIIQPNTRYSATFWGMVNAAGITGSIVIALSSASTGYKSIASVPVESFPAGATSASGAFCPLTPFSLITPAVIPSDLLLEVYCLNIANNGVFIIDELMIVFTDQPYRDTVFRSSYVDNLEAFDGITGTLGAVDDTTPIRDAGKIREALYFTTADGCHRTQDDLFDEPAKWPVRRVGDKCGAVSARSMISGGNWLAWVSQNDSDLSLVIHDGGNVYRISQEIQGSFSLINQEAMSTVWAAIDSGGSSKRIYIGVPSGPGQLTPNLVLPLDYRELDTSGDIAAHGPIHISFTGKMICSDLSRKWTRWNLPLECGAVLYRSRKRRQFCVGSGFDAHGHAFGNVYFFDPLKLTDDDYGQLVPYYFTYGFLNHEMEQALGAGVHRKLYDKVSVFVAGVGMLQVTAFADRIDNQVNFRSTTTPSDLQLVAKPANDIEVPGQVSAERCFFKISVAPIVDQENPAYTNGTDVQFNLQKLTCRLQKHPVSPLRGKL